MGTKKNILAYLHVIVMLAAGQVFLPSLVLAQDAADTSVGPVINSIEILGNQRIEESTIESYLLLNIGDNYDDQLSDASLKRLFNTGLFSDVDIGRRGDTLVVDRKSVV